MSTVDVLDLARVQSPPHPCNYLSGETACMDYRVIWELDADSFGQLLRRGWRRFALNVFRPLCQACTKCRPIRVIANEFHPSKSQRRTLNRNSNIRVTVGSPTVTRDHIRLYDAYHLDMAERRGWTEKTIEPADYYESFIGTSYEFAREFLYWNGSQLVGVGLVDITPVGLSSAYFFHDPQWRDLGPGVYSALTELRFAQSLNLPHVYLGFWIEQNQSMSYKSRYTPHELLARFVDDDEEPMWQRVEC